MRKIYTSFTYPDGESIVLKLYKKDGLYLVTDCGRTIPWLKRNNINISSFLLDTLLAGGIRLKKNVLFYKNESLSYAKAYLIQAIIMLTSSFCFSEVINSIEEENFEVYRRTVSLLSPSFN